MSDTASEEKQVGVKLSVKPNPNEEPCPGYKFIVLLGSELRSTNSITEVSNFIRTYKQELQREADSSDF